MHTNCLVVFCYKVFCCKGFWYNNAKQPCMLQVPRLEMAQVHLETPRPVGGKRASRQTKLRPVGETGPLWWVLDGSPNAPHPCCMSQPTAAPCGPPFCLAAMPISVAGGSSCMARATPATVQATLPG